MSWMPTNDPVLGDPKSCDALELVIVPRTRDLGDGFEVRRALPHGKRQMVGPFIFFDHFGPVQFMSGKGMDVRPHPHIGLATVTYLFTGEIMHRDSLGSILPIRPGALNLMSAGRGGEMLHGLQCWVALSKADEESAPTFTHYDAEALPLVDGEGKRVRVIAGALYGAASPVTTGWPTLLADVSLDAGARLPLDADTEERAVYLVEGEIDITGDRFSAGRLLVFKPGDRITMTAVTPSRLAILGGATMDGPRHIWWNFVSSRQERIDQAKADWKAGRFDAVPGDSEFIPLPD
jgi:redox-sensitive bicupin YhaK (pirin superfamily)